ncbi:MAG: acyl carrier protein [Actinomycetota bacterium]|nr:acyl carrier protein [Actinomycetota bacterium]
MAENAGTILQAIKDHLGSRGLEASKIEPGAELLGDLDLDSLDTVELSLGLEERFGIEIPDEDLEGLVTVADAVALIESKLAATV